MPGASARAWLIFGMALLAYMVSVLHRTTLGVSGVEATERFGVSATTLSSLTVVQVIVYAGLQVPVGVLLDRVGPKLLIATGAALMAAGEAVLALAPDISLAIAGRLLVGAGDAFTFISVMRLLPAWFGGRLLPQVSQWTGTIGQLGQVLSAVPFAALLQQVGWTPAYLSTSLLSLLVLFGVLAFVSNGRAEANGDRRGRMAPMRRLRDALGRPGTRLGFWSHFVTQSSGTVFTLLWGFPFLAVGLGYGAGVASWLLVLFVAAAMMFGPLLGILSARFPLRRSNLILGIVVAMAIAWALVLGWPGLPPFWVVVLLVLTLAIGGPGSLIGFDFARTFNPLRSLGSATGIVNVGGFLASFAMMFLIGVVLDLLDRAAGGSGIPSQLYAFDRFRIAFLVQYLVVGAGVVFLVRSRRRTRHLMQREEGITVAPLWVSLVRRWRKSA